MNANEAAAHASLNVNEAANHVSVDVSGTNVSPLEYVNVRVGVIN